MKYWIYFMWTLSLLLYLHFDTVPRQQVQYINKYGAFNPQCLILWFCVLRSWIWPFVVAWLSQYRSTIQIEVLPVQEFHHLRLAIYSKCLSSFHSSSISFLRNWLVPAWTLLTSMQPHWEVIPTYCSDVFRCCRHCNLEFKTRNV